MPVPEANLIRELRQNAMAGVASAGQLSSEASRLDEAARAPLEAAARETARQASANEQARLERRAARERTGNHRATGTLTVDNRVFTYAPENIPTNVEFYVERGGPSANFTARMIDAAEPNTTFYLAPFQLLGAVGDRVFAKEHLQPTSFNPTGVVEIFNPLARVCIVRMY